MRQWRAAAAASMRLVSARADLWLPGALAWIAAVGWIPFVVAIVRPPSVAELTFLGAGIVASGAWPWNAVLIGGAAVGVVLVAFVLAAAGNAVLIALLDRRAVSAGDVRRLGVVSLVAATPAALSAAVVLIALAVVAPREFNAPDPAGGPIVSTIARLTPYLALLGLTTVAGGALAAVAGRLVIGGRDSLAGALRRAPGLVLRTGAATHAVVAFVAQLAYLAFAALLLGVLWAPIGARLTGSGQIDIGIGLLLVGFVAIWLCLVLAGGALHAWSAATWSRVLAAEPSGRT